MGCGTAGLARETGTAETGGIAGGGDHAGASTGTNAAACAMQSHRQALPQQSWCESGLAGVPWSIAAPSSTCVA